MYCRPSPGRRVSCYKKTLPSSCPGGRVRPQSESYGPARFSRSMISHQDCMHISTSMFTHPFCTYTKIHIFYILWWQNNNTPKINHRLAQAAPLCAMNLLQGNWGCYNESPFASLRTKCHTFTTTETGQKESQQELISPERESSLLPMSTRSDRSCVLSPTSTTMLP